MPVRPDACKPRAGRVHVSAPPAVGHGIRPRESRAGGSGCFVGRGLTFSILPGPSAPVPYGTVAEEQSAEGHGRNGPALVAALSFLAFLPSLAAGYVYDDRMLISENPYAQSARYLARAFRTHLWDVHSFGSVGIGLRYYRPLVVVSYIANWLAGAGAAWTFHLVNVACHALTAWLVARAATRWTESATLGAVAGLVFGLHPSRTESVIWISGRTDVLMALFVFLAVELSDRAARARSGRLVALFAGTALATAGSILSKEAGVLTFLFVLVDAVMPSRSPIEKIRLGRLATLLAGIGVAYVACRSLFYPVTPVPGFEATPRYGFLTVWAYLERVLFPWPQTFFYRPLEERAGVPVFPVRLVLLGVLASVGYLVLLVRAFRRDRPAFVLLLTALALIGPLLNFSYTGVYVTTSDHFLYLPLLALVTGLLRLHREPFVRFSKERAARLAFGGALLVYIAIDALRVLDYRSDDAMWEHEIEVNPDNPVALGFMSKIYAGQGDIPRAYALMQSAVAPSARRFFLLAGKRAARLAANSRVVALAAALVPDGDVRTLERADDELESLLLAMPSDVDQRPLGPRLLTELPLHNDELAAMAADTALVSTRVGHLRRARELTSAMRDDVLWHVPSPLNYVLTVARAGDFARARRLLEVGRHPPAGLTSGGSPQQFVEVARRLARTEQRLRAARDLPEEPSRVEVAVAFADLGLYVVALRELRPVFDRRPHSSDIDQLYVQLLVSARLDREAEATASALLGPERGRAVVEGLRAHLDPRLATAPAPEEPSPWWQGETTRASAALER